MPKMPKSQKPPNLERLSYFRVDRGKANTVAPASSATWRVELANGDNAGVVTPWELPAQDTPNVSRGGRRGARPSSVRPSSRPP